MTPDLKPSTVAFFSPAAQAECSKAAERGVPLLAQGDLVQVDERPSVAQTHSIPTMELPPHVEKRHTSRSAIFRNCSLINSLRRLLSFF